MGKDETFGAFLKKKRNDRTITVRAMAERLDDMAVGYYCDIESGRRNPPDREMLEKMISVLQLMDSDKLTFYDLAGKARAAAPPDLPDYINDNQVVRIALRVAKEKASDEDWRKFIHELKKKG